MFKLLKKLLVIFILLFLVLLYFVSKNSSTPSSSSQKVFSKAKYLIKTDIDNLQHKTDLEYGVTNFLFDITIKNIGEKPLTIYGFAYAENDKISPPARGLWPITAISTCLTQRRRLDIQDHNKGYKINVPAKDVIKIEAAINYPQTWHDGTPIKKSRFNELLLILYSETGERVYNEKYEIENQ